ncbi:MAG: hypothetical protein EON47_20765 [Acetobacteraceae bacterium]|nr:MAG: hypothetical protein EON47_20765 [Acetobacteraceae bacterium]
MAPHAPPGKRPRRRPPAGGFRPRRGVCRSREPPDEAQHGGAGTHKRAHQSGVTDEPEEHGRVRKRRSPFRRVQSNHEQHEAADRAASDDRERRELECKDGGDADVAEQPVESLAHQNSPPSVRTRRR